MSERSVKNFGRTLMALSVVVVQLGLLVLLASVGGVPWWYSPAWLDVTATVVGYGALVLAVASLAHLGDALTALPTPTARGSLRTSGLYRLVRHPTYTCILAWGFSRVVPEPSPERVGVLAALVLLFALKARWEERMLTTKFPEYRAYAARVGRFVPGVGRFH